LVKDQSGKLQAWHQAQDVMVTNPVSVVGQIASVVSDDIELAKDILPTIYVAPKDDSFYLMTLGGKPQDKANHIFHPDDERHLQEASLRLTEDNSKKYSLEKIVSKILVKQDLNLDFANQQLLSDLLYDFFRNRKNSVIVREYLSKLTIKNQPIDTKLLDFILSIIKTIKANIEAGGGLVVKASDLAKNNNIKNLSLNTKAPVKTKVILPSDSAPLLTPSKILVKEPVKPATEILKLEIKPDFKILSAPEIKIPSPALSLSQDTEVIKKAIDLPKVIRPQSVSFAKSKLADVTTQVSAPPKTEIKHTLVGPVDELANMSIDTWRRLGEDSSTRAQRIYEKIAILEKDSVTKKTAGISAWRKSPVYKQYLDLGTGSLAQGQEITNFIKERSQADTKNLSLEEFNAISDLNKLLRF
jgi:hypothetical protein